jgi:hypothetical protein
LTGTLDDIKTLQGPECTPQSISSIDRATASDYLRRTRVEMQRVFGRPLDAIKIRGVQTRNVTSTSGDAEVEYDLPRELAGNDNWVSYEVHNGQWKVANCHAPIGGNSQAATATPPTAAR